MIKIGTVILLPDGKPVVVDGIHELGLTMSIGWIGIHTNTYNVLVDTHNKDVLSLCYAYRFCDERIERLKVIDQEHIDEFIEYNGFNPIDEKTRLAYIIIKECIAENHIKRFKDTFFKDSFSSETLQFLEDSTSYLTNNFISSTVLSVYHYIRREPLL